MPGQITAIGRCKDPSNSLGVLEFFQAGEIVAVGLKTLILEEVRSRSLGICLLLESC